MLEELRGLRQDFDEDRAERALREGPYSGVHRFLPANKAEWYTFIGLLFTICALLLGHFDKPEPPTTYEKEVVQQLREITEHVAEDDDQQEKILDQQQEMLEQLKQINEHLAEEESTKDAKPPNEHR
jgi:hypothetical protein